MIKNDYIPSSLPFVKDLSEHNILFNKGCFSIPHAKKKEKGGEDSYFTDDK